MMAGRRLIAGSQALGVEMDLRTSMYAKLVRLSFGYYDRHQTGQLMSRATVDLQGVRFFLGYGLIFFFQHVFTIVGVGILVFVVSWKLALIAIAIGPLIVAIAYRYSHIAHPVLRDVQQKLADVATVAEENIVGVHVVKSFAQEDAEQAKFEHRSEAVFSQSVRANRMRAGELAVPGGQALDCFAYHGSFALHLARRSAQVMALDASAEALARGARNAALNGLTNIRWDEGDAFEALRALERARTRFETIVVDPPAFAKAKSAVPQALRGYREINLRAMKLLTTGGVLVTASCSFHVRRAEFLEAVTAAAQDSGRTLVLVEHLGQGSDHPEVLTVPETGYLKGVVLRASD